MDRKARRKYIEQVVNDRKIETQEELLKMLTEAGFETTQATISRDIKELGLTKILSSSGKYKYAPVGSAEETISNKYLLILKEAVISVRSALNLVVVKTLKGMSAGICSFIDKLNLTELMGATYGDDTVLLVFPSTSYALETVDTLNEMLN